MSEDRAAGLDELLSDVLAREARPLGLRHRWRTLRLRRQLRDARPPADDDADAAAARIARLQKLSYPERFWHLMEASRVAHPGSAAVLRAYAQAAEDTGRRRHADPRRLLEERLAAAPGDAALLIELGLTEQKAGRLPQAERAFAAVPEDDPDHGPVARAALAHVLRLQGALAESRAVVSAAIARHPGYAHLHAVAGDLAIDAHDYPRAAASFERALLLGADGDKVLAGLQRASRRLSQGPGGVLLRALNDATWWAAADWRAHRATLAELVDDERLRDRLTAATDELGWRLARVRVLVENVLLPVVALPTVVLLLLVWAAVPDMLDVKVPEAPVEEAAATLIGVVSFVLLLGLALAAAIAWNRPLVLAPPMAAYALGAAALTTAGGSVPIAARYGFSFSFAAAAVTLALVLSLSLFVLAVQSLLRRQQCRGFAAERAVCALVRLVDLARDPAPLDTRRGLRDVEEAASALRSRLRRGLPTHDRRDDEWLVARADGVAAAMRERKQLLVAPRHGTARTLERLAAQDVRSIAAGRLGELAWVDPGPLAARQRRRVALRALWALPIGALPVAALIVAQSAGVELSGAVADQAWFAAVVWGVVSLLLTLDPALPEKIDLLGRLNALRPGGRGGAP